jgi:acetyl-CoA C-acetyltransferase
MREVSIIGIGQLPIKKKYSDGLIELGARAARLALQSSGRKNIDALYVGNMLADELQNQKHLAAFIADEAGWAGIEALEVDAASAAGAAAIRLAYLAVASGDVDTAIALGVEKMSEGAAAVPALAKALDAHREGSLGANMITRNAQLMRAYMAKYDLPEGGFANFALNAHRNSQSNPNALFRKRVSSRKIKSSRVIYDPIQLFDSAPVCDGAAAVLMVPTESIAAEAGFSVRVRASSVATDRFRMEDRADSLKLSAGARSASSAFKKAGLIAEDISFFEVHDAFSIMAALQLEAAGFAAAGDGWKLAQEKEIFPRGKIPISTMGGLKARGHPIGATALYQACEIVLQLSGMAGKNQIRNAENGMMQSVGGAASTMLTHIFSA